MIFALVITDLFITIFFIIGYFSHCAQTPHDVTDMFVGAKLAERKVIYNKDRKPKWLFVLGNIFYMGIFDFLIIILWR